ncbi:RnfABCDGE type electron transport complex subunit D [Virgibacillus senegalensis]|uniref:RnfABCDGE type electron transport complex subunit D n=1 Tax=Virgibacillus senegalensis TaxID=1499679 RepID=UPI00069FC662|nr:RnfABCDGE type electron transport complex subunit D [Virgibacillus senegalensis]
MKGTHIVSWSSYKLDPRYLIIAFLLAFAVAGQTYLSFVQGWDAILLSVVSTIVTEIILTKIIYKKFIVPISAFITGLGISLLLSTIYLWPYVVAGVLSIVLKHALQYKGGHIFNPNNIAVVAMISLLPAYVISTPKQWSNGLLLMGIILALGIVVTAVAKRLSIVLSFLISFVVFAYLRNALFGLPLYAAVGPLLGASFQLFAFFMITDPKTTPNSMKSKILFGITVAFIDALFRIQGIPTPQFYALFITSIVIVIPYRYLAARSQKQKTQQTKEGDLAV